MGLRAGMAAGSQFHLFERNRTLAASIQRSISRAIRLMNCKINRIADSGSGLPRAPLSSMQGNVVPCTSPKTAANRPLPWYDVIISIAKIFLVSH